MLLLKGLSQVSMVAKIIFLHQLDPQLLTTLSTWWIEALSRMRTECLFTQLKGCKTGRRQFFTKSSNLVPFTFPYIIYSIHSHNWDCWISCSTYQYTVILWCHASYTVATFTLAIALITPTHRSILGSCRHFWHKPCSFCCREILCMTCRVQPIYFNVRQIVDKLTCTPNIANNLLSTSLR